MHTSSTELSGLSSREAPQAALTPSWGPMWLRPCGCRTGAGSGLRCANPPAAVLREAQHSLGSFHCTSVLPGTLSADSHPSSARCPAGALEEAVLRMLIEHFLLKGKEKNPLLYEQGTRHGSSWKCAGN